MGEPGSVGVAKDEMRRAQRARLASWSADSRRAASIAATMRLLQIDEYRQARTVFAFVSFGDEIDSRPLLRAILGNPDRELCVPRIDSVEDATMSAVRIDSLDFLESRPPWGILEPSSDLPSTPIDALDCVVVPGLAFDTEGRRLGQGKAFYDRFLGGGGPSRPKRLAFAGELQVVDEVPCEDHDARLDVLVTEHFVRRFD